MQFPSRWPRAISAAIVCASLCVAVDEGFSQDRLGAFPVPPLTLNFSDGNRRSEPAVGLNGPAISVAQVAWQSGDQPTSTSLAVPKVDDRRGAGLAKIPTLKTSKKKKGKSGWVKPTAIVSQLETLGEVPLTQQWAADVDRLIAMLLEEPVVSSPPSATILSQLETKVFELDRIITDLSQQGAGTSAVESLSSELNYLRYDLGKRIAIWRAIQSLSATSVRLGDTQLVSVERLDFSFLDQQWQDYLLIEQLRNDFGSLNPDDAAKKKSARKTLARMASPALSAVQKNYLNQTVPATLVSSLKEVASGDVDQYRLLKAIEWNEQKPSGVASNYINDQFQNLLWSQDPKRQSAAAQLQAHYRNANVRLAISQRMLNRLIPASPVVNEPVHEQVLGADVSGQSQIRNRLSVRLVENPTRIAIQLRTNGQVDSETVAKRSGFEIRNEGLAKFQAFKNFTLDRMGRLSSERPVATAQARQRLIGMRSKLDPLPVVNWVARKLARKKLAEQAPQANMLVEQKIEETASEQLQQGVESQVAQMQDWLKVNMLEPLITMDLNPEALQLATTGNRLVMRYRLAGIDQMAADAPRPADSDYDYLTLQLHQSLLNNTIGRIEIESQTFTPQSLMEHLSDVIGFNPTKPVKESKHKAEFVFANYDAIRVELDEGKVRIEFNLKSLRVGEGKTWRNITISSNYTPTVVGTQILLTQEGIIGVKGKKFRLGDQIAVRTIFNVVLPDSYQFETIPQRLNSSLGGYALVLSSLDLANGWLGLKYDEAPLHSTPTYPQEYVIPQGETYGNYQAENLGETFGDTVTYQ